MKYQPKLGAGVLLLAATLFACDEQDTLLDVVRQADETAPLCFGRRATIYPGHPGTGSIVANGAGWTITGSSLADVIVGGPNDDVISGGDGIDRICAGDGADVVSGNADRDYLDGEAGVDDLSYATSPAGVIANLTRGRGAGGDAIDDRLHNFENVVGSDHADVLVGDALANSLEGGLGDDRLVGNDGNDFLDGGDGVDTVRGNGGDDTIEGGAGNDVIIGGSGADDIDGGTGTNGIKFRTSAEGVTVNLAAGTGTGGEAEGDTYANLDDVIGSPFDDIITGDEDANVLVGDDGNDLISGAGGADEIKGGAGADELHGGDGNDTLSGGDGNDELYGDDDDDQFWPGLGQNTVDGGAGTDRLDSRSCTDTWTNIESFGTARCAAAASAATSLIDAAHSELAADGVSTTTITVQLRDAASQNITLGGSTVVLTTSAGLLSVGGPGATQVTAIDQGDGTYTATLTTSTNLETATVTGTLDTNAMTDDADVDFVAGDLHHFSVTGTDGNPIAQQSVNTAFDIKIVAQDAQNHTVTDFTGTVDLISTPGGSLGTTGAFVAGEFVESVTLTSGNNYTITATLSGDTESGTSASFLVTADPGAVLDANSGTSSPGQAYHTAYNTQLVIGDGAQDLLANDNPGFPAATLTHVGAIRCNNGSGTLNSAVDGVTQYTAGTNISLSGYTGCGGGSLQVNSDGTLDYTPSSTYTGEIQFQYRLTNDGGTSDATVTLATGIRPTAGNSTYGTNLIGNVPINTANSSNSVVNAAGDNPSFSITGSVGGTGAVDPANKKYTFTPNAGFTGSASFTFNVTNGFGTSPTTGTVSLTVANMVWFVDASGANGDGRMGTPFNCLVGTNCYDDSANGTGHIIYVETGSYSNAGALVLKDNQRLIGEDGTDTFASMSGLTWPADAGTQPLTNANAVSISSGSGNVVTLASGNTIRGVQLGNAASGTALSGSSFGTLTVAGDVSISAGASQAISLTSGTISGNLGGVTSSGGTNNIALSSVAGTSNFGGGALSGATGAGFSVGSSSGNFTYSGTINNGSASPNVSVSGGTNALSLSGAVSRTSGAGALLSVSGGHATGTVTLTGQITASSGTGLQFDNADGTYDLNGLAASSALNGDDAGIDILNGSGGTFTFGTNLTITHSHASNQAFFSSGSSANVTYSGSIAKSGGGWLIDIFNQSGGTITFQTGTVSASAGGGILMNNADGTVNLNGTTTLNGGDARAHIANGSTGAITFGTGASVTNPSTSAALTVLNTTSATNVTYNGTLTTNAARPVQIEGMSSGAVSVGGNITSTGSGILVQNNSGGTVNFTGATKSISSGANNAVSLVTNPGVTINFTGGGLGLTTTSGIGFNATGGGTINVGTGGNANSISTSTGQAVVLNGVAIGATNASFATIAVSGTPASDAFSATSVTGNTFLVTSSLAIAGTTANDGIDINGSSTAFTFASATVNNTGAAGVRLTNNTGAIAFNAGAIGTTNDPGGDAVVLSQGNANVTFAVPITKNTGAGRLIDISSRTGGTLTFSGVLSCTSACTGISATSNSGGTFDFTNGSKTFDTGASNAINMSSNNGTTINFTNGGLAISTTTGNGLIVTGAGPGATTGGTVTVGTGANPNTILTGGGVALQLQNATSAGLTFRSISAGNGGVTGTLGIAMENTGSGGLTVTGNSSGNCGGDANPSPLAAFPYGTATAPDNADCTGGTIQARNGTNGTATGGIGVFLKNTTNISLTRMRFSGVIQNHAIRGWNVSNLTLDNLYMDGTFGNASGIVSDFTGIGGSTTAEHTIMIDNLTGTANIKNSYIRGSYDHEIVVYNSTASSNLNRLTFDNLTFPVQTVATAGAAIQVYSISGNTNGVMNVTVQNSRFSGQRGSGISLAAQNTTTSDWIVTNNVIWNSHGTQITGNAGISLSAGSSTSDNSQVTYSVTDNRVGGQKGTALAMQMGNGTGTATGTWDNNRVGDASISNSGSQQGMGMYVNVANAAKHKVLIEDNTISQTNGTRVIWVLAGGNTNNPRSGSIHATIRRNTLNAPGNNNIGFVSGLGFDLGTNSTDAYTMCLSVGQGSGNSNTILSAKRTGPPPESIEGVAIDFMSNTLSPGALRYKLLGYPITTHVGDAAGPTLISTIQSTNGGASATGYYEVSASQSTYSTNNSTGTVCDLF